jgi:putative transcriptional regulator
MQGPNLKGKILLATPSLLDPNFRDGVVLMCHHDDDGGMGVLINREQSITLDAVLSDLKLDNAQLLNMPTYEGGPLEPFRGFVLHDGSRMYDSTLIITPELRLTTSRDVLEDIASDVGPAYFMLVLGYAGWAGGQLEDELTRNDWLIAPSTTDIIFKAPAGERWLVGAQSLGIDRSHLSTQTGHA